MEKTAPLLPWGLIDNNDTAVIMCGICRRNCKDFLSFFPTPSTFNSFQVLMGGIHFFIRQVCSECPHVLDPGPGAGTHRCGGQSPERSPRRKAHSVSVEVSESCSMASEAGPFGSLGRTRLRAPPRQGESPKSPVRVRHPLRTGGHCVGAMVPRWHLRHQNTLTLLTTALLLHSVS